MSRIGIGLLIEDEAFNIIRQFQYDLVQYTGNTAGLEQPPHITVKRPVVLSESNDSTKMIAIARNIADQHTALDVVIDSIGTFSDKAIYFGLSKTDELMKMHQSIMSALPGETQAAPIFHATLAHNLTADQFMVAKRQLDNARNILPLKTHLNRIGCFMEVNGQWVVLNTQVLCRK